MVTDYLADGIDGAFEAIHARTDRIESARPVYDVTHKKYAGDVHAAAADAIATGGRLYFPRGEYLLTAPLHFPPAGSGEKAVTVCGDGEGLTQILWNHPTADCLRWGSPGSHYIAGGLERLTVRSLNPVATGRLVVLSQVILTRVCDVTLGEQHAGTGIWIGDEFSQHVHLRNVLVGQCDVGLDVDGVGQMDMFAVKLNQCHARAAIFRAGGAIGWSNGLVQAGDEDISIEIGVGAGRVVNFAVRDIHCETACTSVFRIRAGARYTFDNIGWAAPENINAALIHASDQARAIDVRQTDTRAGNVLVRATNRCSGILYDPPANKLDLDSSCHFTLIQSDWEDAPTPVIGARWL